VPKAVTIGNSKLIADQRANSIIVLANREVVTKVEKILDEMDVKAPQVSLSTVIGQLTLSNNEEFGVDWFAKYNKRFVGTSRNNGVFSTNDPGIPIAGSSVAPNSSAAPVVGNILDPANLINFSQIIQNVGGGTNLYLAAGNAFAAIVHLLESTNRFRVISRPTVFTSNNKKAIIASVHRLHLLSRFDRVVVMEQGRIIEQGPVEQLIAGNGTFAKIWQEYQSEQKHAV